MLVYGRNVAERILFDKKYFKKVKKIYILENYYYKIENLLEESLKSKIKITPKYKIDNLVEFNHQGIIIDMEDYQYTSFDILIKQDRKLVLVLDHIVDPHNFGAIIRTAVAAKFDAIIIPNDRQVLVNSTVIKTSVGAIFDIDIVKVSNITMALKKLKDNGFWIYGSYLSGDDYRKVDYAEKTCLIIGNEEKGISKIVKEESDFLITIPISSNVDSLNASVAAGVLIFEVVRNRK